MKRAVFLYLCAFAFVAASVALYAGLALPGELKPDVAELLIGLENTQCKVVRTISNNSLFLTLKDGTGKELWRSEELGMQARNFEFNKKLSSLLAADIDGDKVPEIILGVTLDSVNSAVYVLKYQSKSKSFAPIKVGYKNSDFERDCMVSDIESANGASIVFETNNRVKLAGKIYTDDGPIYGLYTFNYASGKFICTKQEAMPQAK